MLLPKSPVRSAQMLPLESRRLLAAVYPTAYEQYMVELINRGRANPTAEAARYNVALNEGVPSEETISTAAKQPLAINPFITDAARKHSQWMINNDIFAHNETGGIDPGDRMETAGYVFTGSWTWGENIGYRGTTGTPNVLTETGDIERDLFVDAGIAGRGHRTNLMKAEFREIGVGVVTGEFDGFNAVMATQDFGTTGSNIYLTGVAYADTTTADSFYTPGEGMSGVLVKAIRSSDSASYQTLTWDSGGYSLAVPAGTYTVTASGGSLGGTITYNNVVVAAQNVKKDFTPAQSDPFATITSGKLRVDGTSGTDSIIITLSGNAYTITRNTTSTTLSANGVTSIDIFGQDGDDGIYIGAGVTLGAYIDAGAGNDYIQGGDGPDTITSGAGKDRAFGGLGDDRVAGNGGHDKVNGEAGKDRLYGGEGNDTLDGGSSTDRMWGENGNNTYYGQGGDDYIYARNNFADVLYGQAGNDHAQVDQTDSVTTIEDLIS